MTRFYILRHGETEWNHDHNRYCGTSDIALSTIGLQQASKTAEFLKDIKVDEIYTSPLKRAKVTATIIGEKHSIIPKADSRLTEIDFGKWEGKTKDEILTEYHESWKGWLDDPTLTHAGDTGETAHELFERGKDFFIETSSLYPEGNILVVAHNTFNRLLITKTLGLPFHHYRKLHQNNTGISILELTNKQFNWIQINSIMHL